MSPISPEPLLHLLGQHLTAKYLFVANELGLFATLADEPITLSDLARRVDLPERTLRILADALVATGFLECTEGRYGNGELTAAFLSGGPGPGLRPIVRLWDQLVYPQWTRLEESIRTGRATCGFADFTAEQQCIFSLGVGALTAPSAEILATAYDFGRHGALLDLGGGTGSFLLAVLKRHPGLKATLVELPATAVLVREQLGQCPGGDRIAVIDGDILVDPIPPGHDAILLANVVHLFSPSHNRTLLGRIHSAVDPGTRLLLVDFWTDAAHTHPTFAALMAGEFLIVTGEGDVYSVDEVASWLRATGWQFLEHVPLAGAASLVIAAAG